MASELSSLFPSTPYLLAYTLPVLLLSLILTFAGTFLTLDRTRSFAPKYDAIPGAFDKQKKFRFALEGGIGGLCIGYVFGIHLSTFLALLVPAVSSSAALGPKSFIPVWLLSALLTALLAGRWRYCALVFVGISGGCLFALALSVIIHPALLTRIVLTAVITPILILLVLLPLRCQHAALRFAAASTGAFGVVLSIGLLTHTPAWANAWERLWEKDGETWGTSQEKGLSAGFCLFLCVGMISDWLLKRTFGECPDEKWDSYLANYAANLPNQADRAGTFQPFTSAWDRIFGSAQRKQDIIFPDTDSKVATSSPMKLHKYDPTADEEWDLKQAGGGYLKKARSNRYQGKRSREAVKFRPIGELSDDSGEDDDMPKRPWLRQKTSVASSTPTLVEDYDKDIKKLEQLKPKSISAGLGEGEVPDYSDYEEDVTSGVRKDVDEKEWSPGFMKRKASSAGSQRTAVEPNTPPIGAVPATPSLIKALERVAVAQKAAFPASGLPLVSENAGWDDFWKDVKEKSDKAGVTNTTTTKL